MTNLEDELRERLRTQAQALRVPERPALDRHIVEPRRQPGPRWLIAAACLALIAVGVVALALRPGGDPEPAPPVDSVVPDTTDPAPPVTTVVPDVVTSTPGINGWVAVDAIEDVGARHLPRPARRGRTPARGTRVGHRRRGVSGVVAGRNASVVRSADRFVGHRSLVRRRARDRAGRPGRYGWRPDRDRPRRLRGPRGLRGPPVRDLGIRRPVGRARWRR